MQTSTYQQVNHYYPFGALFGESTGGDKNRYKYNGKELDRLNGLDWYDYGARHLDAALGGEHYVRKDGDVIYIETSNDALSIHEITHVRQSLNFGGLKFNSEGKLLNIGNDLNSARYYSTISDAEIEAYKMQFSYNRSFPGFCKNLNDINVHSVGNITDSTGKPIYYQIYKYSIYLKELEKIKSEK